MERKRRELAHVLAQFFNAHKHAMYKPILAAYSGEKAYARKDASASPELLAELERLVALLDLAPFESLPNEVTSILMEVARNGGKEALVQVMGTGADINDLLTFVDDRAVAWAQERSAEMIGMRRLADGSLIENPNAEWAIDDATRDMIQDTIEQALKEGWSSDRLSKELSDNYGFSGERADAIARTEMSMADAESHQGAWKDAGVEHKQWLRSNEGFPCAPCEMNAMDGVIHMDEAFSSGDMSEPQHPNCECVVIPVIEEQEGETP